MGAWFTGPSLPGPRDRSAVVRHGSHLYVIGGFDGTESPAPATSTVWRHDGSPGAAWEAVADLPEPRAWFAAVVLRDTLLAVGGQSGREGQTTPTNEIYSYDPVADGWAEWGQLPTPWLDLTAAVVEGHIVVFGGLPSQVAWIDRTAVRASDGTWRSAPGPPERPGNQPGVIVRGSQMLVFASAKLQIFDLNTDTWTVRDIAGAGHPWAVADELDGVIHVVTSTALSATRQHSGFDDAGTQLEEFTVPPQWVVWSAMRRVGNELWLLGGTVPQQGRVSGVWVFRR